MIGIDYADAPWNEIVPGLWQGGHDWRDEGGVVQDAIVRDEFDLVVSLYRRDDFYGPAEGVEHLHLRIPDGALAVDDRARVEALADVAARAVKDGRKVLVRCQAGYNRSGLVVALTLLRLGHDAESAIDLVREKRSRFALFNEHFLAYLRGER